MKNTFSLLLIASLLVAFHCVNADTNCPELVLYAACNEANGTCNWTANAEKNTCTQLKDCSKLDATTTCVNEDNAKYCNASGASCGVNNTICSDGANCGATCTKTVNTCANGGNFKCSQQNSTTDSSKCSSVASQCVNDTTKTPTCLASANAACPAGNITTACPGPCTTAAVTCAANGNCAADTPEANCTAANGCTYTPAAGETAASCANTTDCSINTTEAGCTGAAGCQVTGRTCAAAVPADVTTYCTNNLNICNTDTTVESFCTYNANRVCIDNDTFCSVDGPNAATNCGATKSSAFCTLTYNCANPNAQTCGDNTTSDTCGTSGLCTWSPNNVCSNITTDQQCNAANADEGTCQSDKTPGCAFVAGGTCSTKTSGSGSTSAFIIAFSSAFMAIVLAL